MPAAHRALYDELPSYRTSSGAAQQKPTLLYDKQSIIAEVLCPNGKQKRQKTTHATASPYVCRLSYALAYKSSLSPGSRAVGGRDLPANQHQTAPISQIQPTTSDSPSQLQAPHLHQAQQTAPKLPRRCAHLPERSISRSHSSPHFSSPATDQLQLQPHSSLMQHSDSSQRQAPLQQISTRQPLSPRSPTCAHLWPLSHKVVCSAGSSNPKTGCPL
eukprot:gene31341-6494_t